MQSDSSNKEFKKIGFLDYLRAISILFIVFYHYVLEVTLFHIRPSNDLNYGQNLKALNIFQEGALYQRLGNDLIFLGAQGYQFVGVFIFLSGFGLTYSVLCKGKKPWQWLRRITRLLPQFQIAVIFALIVNYLSVNYLRRYLVAVPNLELYPYLRLLLYPIIGLDFYGLVSLINPSLWFSGLILQFYLAYDLLYLLLIKIKPLLFLLITFIVTVLYRYVSLFWYDGNPLLFSLLPVRLFEFAIGMVVAYVYVVRKYDLFYSLKWWVGGLLGGAVWYAGFRLGYTEYGRLVNDLLTTIGLLMLGVVLFRYLAKGWLAIVLSTIGIQSYWIYLLHNQPITQFLSPWTFMQWDARGMSGLVLLNGLLIIITISAIFSLILSRSRKMI